MPKDARPGSVFTVRVHGVPVRVGVPHASKEQRAAARKERRRLLDKDGRPIERVVVDRDGRVLEKQRKGGGTRRPLKPAPPHSKLTANELRAHENRLREGSEGTASDAALAARDEAEGAPRAATGGAAAGSLAGGGNYVNRSGADAIGSWRPTQDGQGALFSGRQLDDDDDGAYGGARPHYGDSGSESGESTGDEVLLCFVFLFVFVFEHAWPSVWRRDLSGWVSCRDMSAGGCRVATCQIAVCRDNLFGDMVACCGVRLPPRAPCATAHQPNQSLA